MQLHYPKVKTLFFIALASPLSSNIEGSIYHLIITPQILNFAQLQKDPVDNLFSLISVLFPALLNR